MKQTIFYVWLFIIVASVDSNPVSQVIPAQQCQQNPYKNPTSLPVTYQQAASQINTYNQPIKVQSQVPSLQLDGSINQLLMSKILGNPCLQKIFDPNTKLYNLNGQQIQRQPNIGTAPNVINNYFIVPPEFFSLNETQPVARSNNVPKKKRVNSDRKVKRTKAKLTAAERDESPVIINDFKPNNRQKTKGHPKKEEKRNKNKKSAKIRQEIVEIDLKKDANSTEPEVKKTKRRRKQNSSRTKQIASTQSPSDDSEDYNSHKDAIVSPVIENNSGKKRKKTRKRSKIIKEVVEPCDFTDPKVEIEDNVSSKNKKITVAVLAEKPLAPKINKETYKITQDSENLPHLKNIESPVDNRETKNLKENSHDTKYNEDTRKTRNSKADRVKKEPTKNIIPIPDDILRQFFPYMYMGNNLYKNNYPLNFQQFYQPNFDRNIRRNKKNKNKKNQKQRNNKETLSNVVEVKLKPKKPEMITTANPLSVQSTEEVQLDNTSTENIIKSAESVTDIPIEKPLELLLEQKNKEDLQKELKPTISKTESVITKANLEMPPTVIEDLHEYITPVLGREDIVPTICNNGIINDYYPTFYDDSYYIDDENYYVSDLENDRHFYTTDRGHQELSNRNTRKYDSNEYYQKPNLDIKDRINFRRGFKYQEKDLSQNDKVNEEHSMRRPYTHERIIEQEKIPATTENIKEVKFQTPPSLENPDFRTKQIEKESWTPSDDSYELHEPVYTDSVEKFSNFKTYSDIKPAKYSKLVSFDSDIKKEKAPATNSKQRNDRIETVFAKSRVVKYSVAKEDSDENSSISPLEYEDEGDAKYHSDGHTTFVVAKSLGQMDDYHW